MRWDHQLHSGERVLEIGGEVDSLCKDCMIVIERHGYHWCTEFGRTGILVSIIEVF